MQRTARRSAGLVTALAVALTFAFGQDADPLAGATITPLGTFTPSDAPERALMLMRITLEPGTTIPEHRHPGAVVVTVESGTFGTTFIEGEGAITRLEGATEGVSAGGSATLQMGDTLAYEGALHTMANEGDDPLVLMVAALLDPDQPGFIFADMAGMDMGDDDGGSQGNGSQDNGSQDNGGQDDGGQDDGGSGSQDDGGQ